VTKAPEIGGVPVSVAKHCRRPPNAISFTIVNTPENWRASRQFALWFTNRSTGFVRGVGLFLVCLSIYLGWHAVNDERRGVAEPPYVPVRYVVFPLKVRRQANAEEFRALMNYEWTCPIVFGIAGFAILRIVRRGNRIDPFSPTFKGNSSLDECERTLDAERRRKHSPIR